jgi:hypothetical protein
MCREDCFEASLSGRIAENDDFTLWHADSLYKVLPSFQPPSGNSYPALRLARNEARYIQLAFTGKTESEIQIIPEPSGEFGINIYSEETVNITHPSSSDHYSYMGPVPDPLLKKDTLRLSQGRTSVALVEVISGKDASPGMHTIGIQAGQETFPLNIHVYDFALPDEVTLKTAFDSGHFTSRYNDIGECTPFSVMDFHNVSGPENNRAVARLYYDDYAENRIAPYSPHWANSYVYDCDTGEFDFTLFDQTLEHYLDDLHMNAAMIKHLFRNNPHPICGYNVWDSEYEGIALPYFSNLSEHLEEKGWLEKSYYMVDEPQAEHFANLTDLADIMVHRTDPPLKIGPALNKAEGYEGLNGSINLWILQNNEGRTVFNATRANELAGQGDVVWWYYTLTQVFNIDSPAVDNMAFPWLAWKYNITGILTWAGMIFDMHCHHSNPLYANPWHNPRSYWGNGQVNFYYPPCIEPCKEPTFEVVPSLRVKLFREGIQDHEYLTMLSDRIELAEELGMDTAAARVALGRVDEVAISHEEWSRSAPLIREVRQGVAEQLENLERALSQPCPDGTLNGSCSSLCPHLFCRYGHLNYSCSLCACHESDTDGDSDVDSEELVSYITRWKLSVLDVPMTRLMEAVQVWSRRY